MKKTLKLILSIILAGTFSINYVSAAIDANNFEDIGDTVNTVSTNSMGYYISNKFVCYACGFYGQYGTTSQSGWQSTNYVSSGIGIYFNNSNSWETGSFAGSKTNSNFNGEYPLSSFFIAAYTGDNLSTLSEAEAKNIDTHLLTASNGTLVTNSSSDVNFTIKVSATVPENKNYVKLTYYVKNNDSDTSSTETINIATFNDIFLGTPIDSSSLSNACKDNASISSINDISNITNGFKAKTSEKYMYVVLEENTDLLSNGGGNFNYWVGTTSEINDAGDDYEHPTSLITNLFSSRPDNYAKAYSDSAFSYSWSKAMAGQEETTFSTLIGLGNLEDVDITIEKFSPNYDSDNKQFDIKTDNKEVYIGGTITDKCGMGTCTYTINGEGPYPCDDETYYTNSSSSFTTSYNTTIPTEKLSNTTENTFEVTATSVACGTDSETTTFTLPKDASTGPKTGINSNYIALGVILLGGIAVYVYSRKHNKFPQV